jgi:two-component system nitrogen regulation sensor histidine kinase NtrY
MGLRLRIFLGMLMVVLLALASTGVVAYFHAQRQDVAYNEQRLHRKEAALSRSLDYVLSRYSNPLSQDSIAIVFTDRICELADVHNLVFTLYNLEGGLITTSADFSGDGTQPTISLYAELLQEVLSTEADNDSQR